MDTVFSLQWPEFVMATRLSKLFPKTSGYSVLVPASREEKGIDLALLKKERGKHTTITFQVKASRTYIGEKPKRKTTRRFTYYTWFNRFDVPDEADFFLLFGSYAPDVSLTNKNSPLWYQDCTLLFTNKEMHDFLDNCFQVSGKPDRQFGFGFDADRKIFQTRGDKDRKYSEYSDFLLENRTNLVRDMFA